MGANAQIPVARVKDNKHSLMPLPNTVPNCALCGAAGAREFHQDKRDYFRCTTCHLVFVPPKQFVSEEEEKKRYDVHQNSPDDPGYRAFLNRLFEPLSERLSPGSSGLDFGSGPGPTLSVMLEEAGFSMEIYDIFYAPDSELMTKQYDFITASEVIEHLHHPRRELEKLWDCLKPQGWLGIMTKRVIGPEAFSRWHYKEDITHVCFFSLDTFEWLADHWDATLVVADDDVVLFQKSTNI